MLGKKQFDYMMIAADKRYKELDEKKKQCHELQGVSSSKTVKILKFGNTKFAVITLKF